TPAVERDGGEALHVPSLEEALPEYGQAQAKLQELHGDLRGAQTTLAEAERLHAEQPTEEGLPRREAGAHRTGPPAQTPPPQPSIDLGKARRKVEVVRQAIGLQEAEVKRLDELARKRIPTLILPAHRKLGGAQE